MLKKAVFSHYVSHTMETLNQNPTSLRFLMDRLSSCIAMHDEDEMIPYSMAKHVITMAVVRKMTRLSYMLRDFKNEKWLKIMFDSDARDNVIIEILDADYKDME